VICVTPVGWLLSLPAGWRCVRYSVSATVSLRLVEAGLAGALVGLVQGLIFALIIAFASPLGIEGESPLEAGVSALIAFVIVGGAGAAVCAGLASGIAALELRRK
jgi:hypothetical protein